MTRDEWVDQMVKRVLADDDGLVKGEAKGAGKKTQGIVITFPVGQTPKRYTKGPSWTWPDNVADIDDFRR